MLTKDDPPNDSCACQAGSPWCGCTIKRERGRADTSGYTGLRQTWLAATQAYAAVAVGLGGARVSLISPTSQRVEAAPSTGVKLLFGLGPRLTSREVDPARRPIPGDMRRLAETPAGDGDGPPLYVTLFTKLQTYPCRDSAWAPDAATSAYCRALKDRSSTDPRLSSSHTDG